MHGHCGVRGNEIADKAAKLVHNSDRSVNAYLTVHEMLSVLNVKFNEY